MTDTPNLSLPYIAPSQAQKHVTHNEALRRLDAVIHLSVVDRGGNAPPADPAEGERRLVGADPAGLWQGRGGMLAAFQDGAWVFLQPRAGWVAWVEAEGAWLSFDGEAWSVLRSVDGETASRFGVNAVADNVSRLSVKSDAVLFSHDDVTPGVGDIRILLNKGGSTATASQLFQTGWSGRAEAGLAGDDDFRIKVSSDGSTWREALVIDRQSAVVRLPFTPVSAINLLEDGGRFAGSPEGQSAVLGSYASPAYLDLINGASRVAGPKRIHDSSTYGGPNAAMDPLVVALLERLKASSARRQGGEWHTMQVTVGTGTTNALTVAGAPHYAPFFWDSAPLPAVCSLNYHFRVLSGSVAINGPSGDTPYLDGSPLAAAQAFTSADGWKQVTRIRNKDPYSFVDYDLRMEQLYGTPGTVFLFALPLLFPGHLPMAPGKLYGPTPSFRAWR